MSAPDVLVVGSGVAGLSTVLELAAAGVRSVLVTTGLLGSGSTGWAQGGIAAAVGPGDDPAQHAVDTLVAGAHHGDRVAVELLTGAAPDRLRDLVARGAVFDRDPDGRLALTREGGHHRSRVAHAGAMLQDAGGGRVVPAAAVVLATGGVGGLWPASTNPVEVTGAGLGLALRAGAALVDVEFVQFHPTALAAGPDTRQCPLITEALRGAGAVLIGPDARALMPGVHPLGDLAPRDVVARRIAQVLRSTGARAAGLDATGLSRDRLRAGFPTVWAACRAAGVDPSAEPIPVAPVQHFLCGGIRVDHDGATDAPGLYAVGEVAATGVHGANRLASNSVVEGLVFGRRLAQRLAGTPRRSLPRPDVRPTSAPDAVIRGGRDDAGVRDLMGACVGVLRDDAGLGAARCALRASTPAAHQDDRRLAAAAIVEAALARTESRGCHWRDDRAGSDPRWDGRRVVVTMADAGLHVDVEESRAAALAGR